METIVERKQTQNKYGIPIVHALVSQAKAVVLRLSRASKSLHSTQEKKKRCGPYKTNGQLDFTEDHTVMQVNRTALYS